MLKVIFQPSFECFDLQLVASLSCEVTINRSSVAALGSVVPAPHHPITCFSLTLCYMVFWKFNLYVQIVFVSFDLHDTFFPYISILFFESNSPLICSLATSLVLHFVRHIIDCLQTILPKLSFWWSISTPHAYIEFASFLFFFLVDFICIKNCY